MNKKYQTVLLAALLHDIGKFYQKGDCRYFQTTRLQHPEVSLSFIKQFKPLFEEFTDYPMLMELVQKHHENSRGFSENLLVQNASPQYQEFAYIISCADNLSSKERDDESEHTQNYRTRPMASIFTSISLEDEELKAAYYRPSVFQPHKCFPDKELVQNIIGQNTQFIEKFTYEIQLFSEQGVKDFNTLYTLLNSLLLKYLWCIPSSSFDKVPDVSLYDHLKTTSAIAACLYLYHEASGDYSIKSIKDDSMYKFKMVLGDFSGIQKFIFQVSNVGEGGIAKRLRARSFYVNILLEIISHYICHSFNVPLNNILISSGGKFYILLPNTQDADEKLNGVIKDVEDFLFRESSGEISINIAVKNICGKDFDSFDDIIASLNEQLHEVKKRPYETVLQQGGKWNEKSFIVYDDLNGKTLCRCCNKNMVSNDSDKICKRCSTDQEMGQMLANASYIYYCKGGKGIKIFKDYSICITKDIEDIPCYLAVALNTPVLGTYALPISIKYMANHIPCYNEGICDSNCQCQGMGAGQPLTFECIAKNASGRKLLGVYKADVDNLGFLFMEGLKRTGRKSKNTVSRITTFSRMLEMFFSGYIQQLIQDKYPLTYCVFSGGDDLFLIGPWDKMMDMAVEINKEFKKYTAYNPCFTLSAGMVTVRPKYPISKAAEEAEEQLKKAKEGCARLFYNEVKNQIAFMDDPVKWDDFEYIIEKGKYVENLLENSVIHAGQVRRLMEYSRMYRDFLSTRNVYSLRFLAMLSYDISRNYQDREIEEIKFKEWVLKMRKEINRNKDLYYLNLIGEYALMKTREEE